MSTDIEILDGQVVEDPPHSMEVVRRERRSEVMRPLNRQDLVEAEREYQQLVVELLTPEDHQTFTQDGEEKSFKKKSAWRKLARAFDLDVRIVALTIERDHAGGIMHAQATARAIAPSGRAMDGTGRCSITEKRRFDKAEHDVPATAETRAKNRAISDLLGTGEVSAEEVEGQQQNTQTPVSGGDGKPVTAELQPHAVAACIKIAGGDREAGKALWEKVKAHFGGRMPHAAAIGLVEASRAMFDTPIDPQWQDPDGPIPADAGPPDEEPEDPRTEAALPDGKPTEEQIVTLSDSLFEEWRKAGLSDAEALKKVKACRGRWDALQASLSAAEMAVEAKARVAA